MEEVGGALERVLQEAGWHFDAIDRVEGLLDAGQRGWFGYRTFSCRLQGEGSMTRIRFETSLKASTIEGVVVALREALGLDSTR